MNTHININLISKRDLIAADCIDYDEIISVIEDAFVQFEQGRIILPDKTTQIFHQEKQDRINCMPSTLLNAGVSGVKWVSVFPENPKRYGVPNVSGLIVLSELEKGQPFAVMDGTLITALRTAAMGAIGAKYLARLDSTSYGSIGAGEQAKMHFKLIKHVLPGISECRVSSRTKESENSFCREMKELFPDVNFFSCNGDTRAATSSADVIVTAVSCQEPLLKADSVKTGAFYCHVGGWEDEYSVPQKADKIVCDNWEALKHRGSPTLARLFELGKIRDEDIYADIAEIICGIKKGRENDSEFIYFNSIGLSFVDVAIAYSFYNRVLEKELGQLWSMS